MAGDIMKELEARAKADPQRIALPEAEEEKILRAAREVFGRGLAIPVLVGAPGRIAAAAEKAGVSVEGMTIVDYTSEENIENLANRFSQANPDYSARAAKRMLKEPLNFAAMLVRFDEVDCMVAGLSHTTGEVILAGQMIVGTNEAVSTVSSMGILSIPGYTGPQGDLLAFADCAVCAAPGPEELADIAISTSDTVRSLLGWEPRVALLSFSTKGSASHERVDMVLEALRLVRDRRPELLIDGELQLDAAIVPEVAARKVKEESQVAGRANVLIFPDLESANIGVKLVQRFAKAVAYGPLLQGFSKPISDLSRGAPVEEIVGAITMVAVSAQSARTDGLR